MGREKQVACPTLPLMRELDPGGSWFRILRIRRLARERGMTLSDLLSKARVSRTAYYSLARRSTVLPQSIHALAATLDLAPSALLAEPTAEADSAMSRVERARAICAREPQADFDTVRHTLALLDLPPLERLNRSLVRGRAAVQR